MPIRRSDGRCSPAWERGAELAVQTGQPIQADLQRARQIISESGFAGLFKALKRGAALPAWPPGLVLVPFDLLDQINNSTP